MSQLEEALVMGWKSRRSENMVGWWNRRNGLAEDDVTTECEAFLSGSFERLFDRRGEPVPAWARLNEVVHAPRERVAALAATAGPPRRLGQRPQDWREAAATLAADLLRLAGDDRTLRSLQLRALLPVELALMGEQADLARTPEELLRIARVALFGSPRVALGGADA